MSRITEITLPFGPTIRARIEMMVEDTGRHAAETDHHPRKFGERIDIPVRKVTGINAIQYNDNVGGDEEKWTDLEEAIDLGQLVREHAAQQREIEKLRRRNQQYETRLATLQIHTVETVETEEPSPEKRRPIRAKSKP